MVSDQYTGVMTWQWRHNGHDGVSNHQPRLYLLNGVFRRRSKKISKIRVTGLCAENSPETGEFPAQMASYAKKCFHLMTSSWKMWYLYWSRTHLIRGPFPFIYLLSLPHKAPSPHKQGFSQNYLICKMASCNIVLWFTLEHKNKKMNHVQITRLEWYRWHKLCYISFNSMISA